MGSFAESTVEEAALSWFGELGYSILAGPELAPGELVAGRSGFADVILTGRFSRTKCGQAAKKLSEIQT